MSADETVPLTSTDDVHQLNSPSSLSHQQSALKIQLLELYKSVDIEENESKTSPSPSKAKKPLEKAFSAPTGNAEPDADDDNATKPIDENSNKLYDKQYQLEEAEMIQKLSEWIEQKGKPAIKKVSELQMKCDVFEQELKASKLEVTTMHDELSKLNKEKHDLELKYKELQSHEAELQETIKTLKFSHDHHEQLNTKLNEHHEDNTAEIKRVQSRVEEINKNNNDLKTENENLVKLNTQYQEQNNTLKTKIATKDEQITELTKDRDDWESKYDSTHESLLERLQQINQLNSENANLKHQVEILGGDTGTKAHTKGMHSNMKTLRNVFQDSTGDLLQDKSNDSGFVSNTNIMQGIYGMSTTNIVTERENAFGIDLNNQNKYKESIDEVGTSIRQEELDNLRTEVWENVYTVCIYVVLGLENVYNAMVIEV